MPSRQAHCKSRHGCTNCKKRRVKVSLQLYATLDCAFTSNKSNLMQCDELRPICSTCSRRGAQCEYDTTTSLQWVNGAAFRRELIADDTSLQDCALVPGSSNVTLTQPDRCTRPDFTADSLTSLNMIDLELLMHWKDATYQIFCRSSETRPIWQYNIPQLALEEPFLMHGVLALSAIHLAQMKDQHRRSTYIAKAVSHQSQALTVFRPSLHTINESNSMPLFAFASIVTVYAFAFPAVPDSSDPRAAVDDIYQVIVFAQGLHQILNGDAEHLQNSILRPLFQWDDVEKRLTEDASSALNGLREAVYALSAEGTRESYLKALNSIQDSLCEVLSGFDAVATATRTAIRMPSMYVALLRKYDPLALVILSFYCVVLHRLRHHWCLGDSGARIVRAISLILGPEWKHLLHWPMADVFGPNLPE